MGLQGNTRQYLVSLLWILPALLYRFDRRVATSLALIPVAILWTLFFLFMIMRIYGLFGHDGEPPLVDDSPAAYMLGWACHTVLFFIPLSIMLVSGIRMLIRYFKDAKCAAALADSEEIGAK